MVGARFMRFKAQGLVPLVLLMVAGCAKQLERSDLVGTYVVNYSHGTETLILKQDGSYEQDYMGKDGKKLANTGTWETTGPSYGNVSLFNAMEFDDGHDRQNKAIGHIGVRELPVSSFLGKMSLTIDPDSDANYKKVEQ